jgi:Ca-activated chloride channel homolog
MAFSQPFWLLLLLLLPLLWWYQRQTSAKKRISMPLPQLAALSKSKPNGRTLLMQYLPWLRFFSLALFMVAMARPQKLWKEQKVKADAIDIMLAMDISPSMLTKDFSPDRLSVAKQVAIDFVGKRPYDRLGLVAFSAEAFTQSPLTTDLAVVQEFIKTLLVGKLEDGTAIGMGLATAVNRLKDSEAKSKIIILLTDGENNAGYIKPLDAAEIAKTLGVRVYTIGIGTDGTAIAPVARDAYTGKFEFAMRSTSLNTELLEQIASVTGGKFYRALDEEDLSEIYATIEKLEKTPIEVTTIQKTSELFYWFVNFGMLLLALEIILRWGFLRSIT